MLALARAAFVPIALVAVTAIHAGDEPEFRGTSIHLFHADPIESRVEADAGWGFGLGASWNLPGTPAFVELGVGLEGGVLESDVGPPVTQSGNTVIVVADTHDYFALLGGAKLGLRGRSPARPHFGIHLALARQDFKIQRFDPLFGEFEQLDSDSDSGFAYDVSGGVLIKVSRSVGLDLGARRLWLDEVSLGSGDRRGRVNSDYWLYYLGLVLRSD